MINFCVSHVEFLGCIARVRNSVTEKFYVLLLLSRVGHLLDLICKETMTLYSFVLVPYSGSDKFGR